MCPNGGLKRQACVFSRQLLCFAIMYNCLLSLICTFTSFDSELFISVYCGLLIEFSFQKIVACLYNSFCERSLVYVMGNRRSLLGVIICLTVMRIIILHFVKENKTSKGLNNLKNCLSSSEARSNLLKPDF